MAADPTRAEQLAYYAAGIKAKQGATYSNGYLAYAAAHPTLTPLAAARAYEVTVALQGLKKGLGAATTGAATAESQAIKGAVAGANSLYSPGGASAACALQFPGIAGIGKFCVLSDTALRATVGGLVLAGAGVIGITAAVVLAAYGLGHTKSGQALQQSAGAVAKGAAVAGLAG